MSMTNIAKPTPEMIEAGVKAWYDTDHEGSTVGQSVCDIYTAMVASAPQEPVADDDALIERLRGRVKIETACGNRTESPNNHVRLMTEAADAIERLQAKAPETD